MPYSTALDVDVDHPVPLVDLQPLEQRLRHEARVVDHDVDASVRLNGPIDQPLHLIAAGDVGLERQRFAAAAGQFGSERRQAIDTSCAEDDARTARRQAACRGFAESAARAGDDDHLSSEAVAIVRIVHR